MFISKVEKIKLTSSVMDLLATVQKLDNDIIYLKAKIKTLEDKAPKKKRNMSAEGRAKMSQIMKERHAKIKLEKEYVKQNNH
jgi:outer membrane murein-binding lipoprotein Lpp